MNGKTEKWKPLKLSRKKKEKGIKSEDSLRELWDNIKSMKSHLVGVPEGQEREGLRT